MTRSRQWILGTAVLVVVILAVGWFFLISPKKSDASSLADKTQQQQSANAQLVVQLQQLKAQDAQLPELEAQLAAIQQHIPLTPALPAVVRNFSAAATNSGVTLTAISPNAPAEYPAGQNTPIVLWTASTAISVNGSYFSIERFLSAIESMQRSFLVTGFELAPVNSANAASTGATTSNLALTLNGQIYFTAPPTGDGH
jgi:Tfp pilus assembly protein PilO